MYIVYDLIIGNILLSKNRNSISKDELNKLINSIYEELPDDWYPYGDYPILESFLYDYSFLVEECGNEIIIKKNMKILERYFRIGVPKELVSICNRVVNIETNKTKLLVKKGI